MSALTTEQRRCLEFIIGYDRARGQTPSYDEICEGLGVHSKSCVHRLITALDERGFIRRIPNRARAIEVLFDADGNARNDTIARMLAVENFSLRQQVAALNQQLLFLGAGNDPRG